VGDSATKLADELGLLISADLVNPSSFIAFIDDGSRDQTWNLILDLASRDPIFRGLKLAANVGHQNALLAGLLSYAEAADCLISIDADLQDDLSKMAEMIKKYQDGFEVVYGVRQSRGVDSWFKRFTAETYYKILNILGVKIVYNHADFRLIGRQALEALGGFREVNLFLRGLVPLLGFKTTTVAYERKPRLLGESKYPLRKMLKLAFDGITSFSAMPLRFITTLGFVVFILSLGMSAYALLGLFYFKVVPGWVSIVLPMYLLGGIQLLAIGIIGEYLAKIYREVKNRPRFIIEEKF
jgi:glycosyltransferase involved in cell wall biosynthesis